MSVRIRLARGGSKKRPFYRVVAADIRAPRDGRFIEKLGTFNPLLPKDHEQRLVLNEERVKHWLSVGASPTDRVHRFLAELGYLDAPAIPNQTKQHLPKAKAQERLAEQEEKKRQAEEDAKAAAEEAAAAEAAAAEAPAEEVAAEEVPAEEAAAEEAPAEEAPAEEASEEAAEEEKAE